MSSFKLCQGCEKSHKLRSFRVNSIEKLELCKSCYDLMLVHFDDLKEKVLKEANFALEEVECPVEQNEKEAVKVGKRNKWME